MTADCYAVDELTHCVADRFLERTPTFQDQKSIASLILERGGCMVASVILGERRRALRVPVRGVAVLHPSAGAGGGPLHAMIENLSQSGALFSVASRPTETSLDVEIRLTEGSGWVVARVVRV